MSWGSVLLVVRAQEHKPALAEQQLCPQLLFLFTAITPSLVSGKPVPVSLAYQSTALIQRLTSVKRQHYSAVTAMPSSAFPFPWSRQTLCARDGYMHHSGKQHCWELRFPTWTVSQKLCTFPTKGLSMCSHMKPLARTHWAQVCNIGNLINLHKLCFTVLHRAIWKTMYLIKSYCVWL